jgi:predicted glycosyltransferase
LLFEWISREFEIYKIAKKINPDIFIGVLSPTVVHAGKILGKKTIVFTDSEPEAIKFPILDWITLPFADTILTLSSVQHNYGKKEVRINSYKELAYLHPKWFIPNPQILKRVGLSHNDKYLLLRFIGWAAYHDVGRVGFDIEHQRLLIRKLTPHARIFISSEKPLPEEFEEYRIPIKPEEMHDFSLLCFTSGE